MSRLIVSTVLIFFFSSNLKKNREKWVLSVLQCKVLFISLFFSYFLVVSIILLPLYHPWTITMFPCVHLFPLLSPSFVICFSSMVSLLVLPFSWFFVVVCLFLSISCIHETIWCLSFSFEFLLVWSLLAPSKLL